MCGIAGIVDRIDARDIDANALRRMTSALVHRGPDDEGYHMAAGVGFGHRRLAIIDLAGGSQPFYVLGGVLSFNGEIYNYEELRNDLAAKGARFRTQSDTEALAEGLAREGDAFIAKLRGMFAISWWNPATKTLTLARDRLGEKPLYYAETSDGCLVFASEIGALASSGLIELDLSNEAIADYFYYGYVPDPKTIYRGVKKLPPGCVLTARPGEPVRVDRYWRPRFETDAAMDFSEAAASLCDILDDAVGAQMIADVPLGAFLSGGVDSSGIVASMASTGISPTTCTIGFSEASHDERAHARVVAEKFNANHYEHEAAIDATSIIDAVARAYGEPFADTSALPTYLVSQLTRQHVTVALSGDGGDEIFAGYRRYPFFLAEERVRRLVPLAVRQAVMGRAGALYPRIDWAPRPFRLKSTLQSLAAKSAEGYAASVAINVPDRVERMLSDDFKHALRDYRPQSVIANAMAEADTDDPLAAAQYADLATWLPGRMLTKVDRASMAHSLEVRPPLLDHKLVEWAGRLPRSYMLDREGGKRVLKAALEERLGRDFLVRKKQGFELPVSAWLRATVNNPADRLRASRAWRESGILNEETVDGMAKAHLRGSENNAQELWTAIMFDAFLTENRNAL